jgi:hypothetical protein
MDAQLTFRLALFSNRCTRNPDIGSRMRRTDVSPEAIRGQARIVRLRGWLHDCGSELWKPLPLPNLPNFMASYPPFRECGKPIASDFSAACKADLLSNSELATSRGRRETALLGQRPPLLEARAACPHAFFLLGARCLPLAAVSRRENEDCETWNGVRNGSSWPTTRSSDTLLHAWQPLPNASYGRGEGKVVAGNASRQAGLPASLPSHAAACPGRTHRGRERLFLRGACCL